MRKILHFISSRPLLVSILVLIPLCIALDFITKQYYGGYDRDFYRDFLINLYNIPVEILVFGILILYLNNFREKQVKIQSYQDEIDDLKIWE
jgi:undecaprenyl pyrophosphate phosphatase UppP